MKKITIPKSYGHPIAPFWLNKEHYTFPSGREIEVPDEIAALLEAAMKNIPKPEMPIPNQPDLSQNDPTAADYVKNRTHWVEENEFCDIDYGENHAQTFVDGTTYLNRYHEGEVLGVEINGVKYYCELKYANFESGELYVGNQSLGDYEFSESVVSDEPFLIYFGVSSTDFYTNIEADKYKWKIYVRYKDYHKLDIGYIPYEILDNMPLAYIICIEGEDVYVSSAPDFWDVESHIYYGVRPLVIRVEDCNQGIMYDGMFVKTDFSNIEDEGVINIHFMYGDNPNNLKSLTITHTSNNEDWPTVSQSAPSGPQ